MREWSERHIRELIDDEFKKLKKLTGGGGVELQIDSGIEPSDFFYLKNDEFISFNEENLNGIILFDRKTNLTDSSSIEYYNFKFINEREASRDYNIRTYELFDGVMKFDDKVYEWYNHLPYLTSIPNGQFVSWETDFGERIGAKWTGEYLSPFNISSIYLLQNDIKYSLVLSGSAINSGYTNRYLDNNVEYDLYSNGRTVVFKGMGDIWNSYDYNKPSKLIVESYRFII